MPLLPLDHPSVVPFQKPYFKASPFLKECVNYNPYSVSPANASPGLKVGATKGGEFTTKAKTFALSVTKTVFDDDEPEKEHEEEEGFMGTTGMSEAGSVFSPCATGGNKAYLEETPLSKASPQKRQRNMKNFFTLEDVDEEGGKF
jgi:hypothetical protein